MYVVSGPGALANVLFGTPYARDVAVKVSLCLVGVGIGELEGRVEERAESAVGFGPIAKLEIEVGTAAEFDQVSFDLAGVLVELLRGLRLASGKHGEECAGKNDEREQSTPTATERDFHRPPKNEPTEQLCLQR